jgi:hypothetical protein
MLIAFCNVNATKLTCFINVLVWFGDGNTGTFPEELAAKINIQ